MSRVRKLVLFGVVVAVGGSLALHMPPRPDAPAPSDPGIWPAEATAAPAADSFTPAASGTQMRVSGRVQRLLADDRDGSRHQRFIIATDAGTTLLIAHNIDLAPRLDGLATGEPVEVYGEYEWNDKGGLIHWTHEDPGGRHVAGYVEWRGRRYQ